MWIVSLALRRPYTFIVVALIIILISPLVIARTPTDIFPNINIPVIASVWTYTGMSPEQMEQRVTSIVERGITTVVGNIEHTESITLAGRAIIKTFLQPGASVDTANAQETGISQSMLKMLPPGIQPPFILTYSASTVPILQLAVSSKTLSEAQLNDYSLNFIRPDLVTVRGAEMPYPYGGKQRQVNVSLNNSLLQAKGLSPSDVVTAIGTQNIILPSGTAKIGPFEYNVDLNSTPLKVSELNDLPIKLSANNTPIYVRDVATVSDGFAPQTNIVRLDGERGALISVLKNGDASTLSVVKSILDALPQIRKTLPSSIKIEPIADQSIFVRAAITGVVREAIIAACLTGIMILVFLGSWRSTLIIAVSIPLSILVSIICLSALGETLNIMTLGGLALAVGILVDDATVEIENINRNLAMGKELRHAILDGAQQIAIPAFVATLCICIVFLPMFFLSGVAKYLFIPLAEAVVFAMLASYLLSRTLVPTLAMYLLKGHDPILRPTRNPLVLIQRLFEHGFERLRLGYELLLTACVYRRAIFVPLFLVVCACVFSLITWLGQDFFPSSDNGQIRLHLRAKTGTRIEETARLNDIVDHYIRRVIPSSELASIVDNLGLPYSGINTTYDTSGVIGTSDADILISLKEPHRPVAQWIAALRPKLIEAFPGVTFYFLPADMITQILNFGLPAPIDVQVEGANADGNRIFADQLLSKIRRVSGAVDLRIQQPFDQPRIHIAVDRTKAQQAGLTESDVAGSLLVSLSGSFQTTPTFFLNPANGVSYSVVTQTPQYRISSPQDLENIPVTSRAGHAEILGDVGSISRGSTMAVVNHYNIHRVIDIFGSVEGRDLGSAGNDIARIVDANRKNLPRGSTVTIRGQLETMKSSYLGLAAGLFVAIALVYFLIVVNFQSWLDPFIIISALPAALSGIVLFLFLTQTRLSVPALMGSIMCMGVATANSILVVSFARERMEYHGDALQAAIEAGFTRFRPVIMTALAMIIGMVPMALSMGEGGEQNAPLGRAVIGGLICATVATLFFVPSVFSLIHNFLNKRSARRAVHRPFESARH
jgi:multidrug efflux pump subunit AcrB